MAICDICGNEYSGHGNNAYPFGGRCCNDCNEWAVIPARVRQARFGRKLTDDELNDILRVAGIRKVKG